MPEANISDVTNALARLLTLRVRELTGSTDLDVTSLPPEKADEVSGTHLNLHLYLAAFDADGGTGILPFARGSRPIAITPLPLKLYYVMTAHGAVDDDDEADIAGQQRLIGWGMKTFHDYPLIKDDLSIGPDPVVPGPATFGDRGIEIILRPITPEESVAFWSTDQVRTARLAAYYEVRTLLLPPEEATSSGGPVADFTLGVFAGGAPTLTSSSSETNFVQPAALGGAAVSLPRSPAAAMLRTGVADQDSIIVIEGSGLGDGTDAALILRGESLPEDRAIIYPASNPEWEITVTDNQLRLRLRPAANAIVSTGPTPITLLPGIYSLTVQRTRELADDDGTITRNVEHESNRLPFAAAPRISSAVIAGGNVVIATDPGYDATDPAAEPSLSLAGSVYREVPAPASDPGTFARTAANEYRAVALPGVAIDSAVRLSVNGVDAQPFWIGT